MNIQVPGFRFSGVVAGIKKKPLPDLGLITADRPTPAAAVFTQNRVKAAPVRVSQERIKSGLCQAIVVNSGNANACTGRQGQRDAVAMADRAARAVSAKASHTLVASTGVIGVPLPMARVQEGIVRAAAELSVNGFPDFAQAILTTDKGPKVHTTRVVLGKKSVTLAGCAKGAGMIAPNMATTLAFVVTDAACDPAWMRRILREEADATFNSVSVDGDTSTNDSLFLLASGAAGTRTIGRDDPDGKKLRAAIRDVLWGLARELVRDGEGATKLVTIQVLGARTQADARAVAKRIATSPLVKTAIAGADPNWGRILCAAGNAGAALDPERIDLDLDEVPVVRRGVGLGTDKAERDAHAVMKKPEYTLRVHLHHGRAKACHTTCDLTHEYITINADYRS
jgi:glutamate N-acetyltransferase/amino-acid N-acetyltransferase